MSIDEAHTDILKVRDASRRMVRLLGFMRPTLAGTELSTSAVHAIIEIGSHAHVTANRLSQALRLEKSSVSRLLDNLARRGLIEETASSSDGRVKNLALTQTGQALLANIHRFADHQVATALRLLSASERAQVVNGLGAYADALERSDGGVDREDTEIAIHTGYRPGAIGRIADMHARYYARAWNFPPSFEAKVAAGLADFVPRLDRPGNGLWLAISHGQIKGSAAIDGEDLGNGLAHLRWVIVDEDLRGAGIGRRLLTDAIAFCDAREVSEIHLWTFSGLDAARALYEAVGFELAESWLGDQWGRAITEQRFIRKRPGSM